MSLLRIVVAEPHYYDRFYGLSLGVPFMDALDAIHFACVDFCDALDEAAETLYDMPWLWTR